MILRAAIQMATAMTLAGILAFSGSAQAQEAPNPELGDVVAEGQVGAQPTAIPSGGAVWSTSGQAPAQTIAPRPVMAPPPVATTTASRPAEAEAPPPASKASDHSAVVGNLGVGFFGVTDVPIGDIRVDPVTGVNAPYFGDKIAVPTVGVRSWLSDTLGVEGALGFMIKTGSGEARIAAGTVKQDPNSGTAFALHGGVPIALAHTGHLALEMLPELNLGFSTGTVYTGGGNKNLDSDISGLLVQIGVHAGAEIHFGFIGIPRLALQASLGLHFSYESRSLDRPNPTNYFKEEYSRSDIRFGTTLGNKPGDILSKSINVIYYFD